MAQKDAEDFWVSAGRSVSIACGMPHRGGLRCAADGSEEWFCSGEAHGAVQMFPRVQGAHEVRNRPRGVGSRPLQDAQLEWPLAELRY